MSILLEAIDLIIEAARELSPQQFYDEVKMQIANKVGFEKDGMMTKQWLGGQLKGGLSDSGVVMWPLRAYHAKKLDPKSKEFRDAMRTDILFSVLASHGLAFKKDNGTYGFPSAKRSALSEIRRAFTGGFNDDKVAGDLGKATRDTKYGIDQEWANSLPPDRKRMLDAYTEMSVEALNMLWSFVTVKGPSDVATFRRRVNDAKFAGSNDFTILKTLGFINQKDLLNAGMVKMFIGFIKDPDGTGTDNGWERLLPFNPELTNLTRRITGTQARARNAAGRELDHLRDPDAAQTPDEMNPEENRAMNSRIRDIEDGTRSSTKNDRARDQKRNFSDVFKRSFN
jgi:hypothetical protein